MYFSACRHPVVSAPLDEEIIFAPLLLLLISQRSASSYGGLFLGSILDSLIYLSVAPSSPHYADYCSFKASQSQVVSASNVVLPFEYCVGWSGPLLPYKP